MMVAPTVTDTTANPPDDTALVRAARHGDMEAFESLVSRHERRIYGLARRMTGSVEDAQDVTQQTFISAVRNLSRFRETAAFSTWLTTIATHAALKVVRKRRSLPTHSLDEATAPAADGHIPHPHIGKLALHRHVPEISLNKTSDLLR